MAQSKLRVAVIADFLEEGWPSMDLVAEMLADELIARHGSQINALLVRPPMVRRFTRVNRDPNGALGRKLLNADRLLNRFLDYPRHLRRIRGDFDVFHVTDHSYAQLAHEVPHDQAVVTCHDVEAFLPLLDAVRAPRSPLFRTMTARILGGLKAAARVGCDSEATRNELARYGAVASDRLATIPNGVSRIFSPLPDPGADREAARLLGPAAKDSIDILHVGSTIARKRIDLLLRTVATVRAELPAVRLIRVGGPFTRAQSALLHELRLADAVVVLPLVSRVTLAAIYRRAALLMVTSDLEGFGLPVVEAMACGVNVLASGLAVLREVGGDAVEYAPAGEVEAWSAAALRMVRERSGNPTRWAARRAAALSRAAEFSWSEYARRYAEIYQELLH